MWSAFEDFLKLVLVDQVKFSSHEVHLGNTGPNLFGPGKLYKSDFFGHFGHFVTEH
jgi:hypothetical protein